MTRVLSLLVVLSSAAACGSASRGGGGAPLNPELLVLGVDSMRISAIQGTDTVVVGTQWDELHRTERDGRAVLVRVYRTTNRLFGPHLDTMISVLPALRPHYSRSISQLASGQIRFTVDSVLGWHQTGGGRREVVSRAVPPDIHEAGMFDMLVRSAPLREGYTVAVTAYLRSLDTVATLSATVVGSELVRTLQLGTEETWVVEMDFAGLISTMWISKASRRLVKQVIVVSPSLSMLLEA